MKPITPRDFYVMAALICGIAWLTALLMTALD